MKSKTPRSLFERPDRAPPASLYLSVTGNDTVVRDLRDIDGKEANIKIRQRQHDIHHASLDIQQLFARVATSRSSKRGLFFQFLLGLGQFYSRAGRCHLARLAIAPECRGRGLGAGLIRELAGLGCRRLDSEECGLFVMADNNRAVRLYTRLGFVATPYPEVGFELPGCVYMVASVTVILEVVGRHRLARSRGDPW